MKKEEIVKQLEATKALSSQVDIDKVIALINQIEPEIKPGIPFSLAQEIIDSIHRGINRNSDGLVDKDSAEFELSHDNRIELYRVDVYTDDIMEYVKDAIDPHVMLEEEEEDDLYDKLEKEEEAEDDDTVRIRLSDINE
jgi:hypothetical protein